MKPRAIRLVEIAVLLIAASSAAFAALPGRFDDAFGGRTGAFIAIDVDTGRRIAHYDTEDFLKRRFPIGSVTKLFTAIAGLESGALSADRKVFCPPTKPTADPLRSCWNHDGHGDTGLIDALAYSCNYYFIQTAGYVDYADFRSALKRFGLGGGDPETVKAKARLEEMAGLGTRPTASPVELAAATAALYNGGRLFNKITDKSGGTALKAKLKDETIRVIQKGMKASAEYGTSRHAAANLKGARLNLHGKTGTAKYMHKGRGDARATHGWWVGVFDAEPKKRIAIVVFILDGAGRADAAMVGGKLVEVLTKGR